MLSKRLSLGMVGLLLVIAAAGCAAVPAATSSSPPSSEQTSTPLEPGTRPAFDGDCASVIGDTELSEIVGVSAVPDTVVWDPGAVARLGGITCGWEASGPESHTLIDVSAFPASVAGEPKPSTGECEATEGERVVCDSTALVGDLIISVSVVSTAADVDGRRWSEEILARASERASTSPPAYPAERSPEAWQVDSCAAVLERVGNSGAFPADAVAGAVDDEGPIAALLAAHGEEFACTIHPPGGADVRVSIWPGAGESFSSIPIVSRLPGADPYEAVLAPDLLDYPEAISLVVVSDGTNLVAVDLRWGVGENGPDPGDEIALGVAIMEELGSRVGSG